MAKADRQFDAWHPGLNSELPAELLPLVTLYRPENSDTTYRDAKEAADFCGSKPQDMVAFKVSRLAMHDVLIRVTADLYVPDGPSYEELGLNLRSMAGKILFGHVLPQLPTLEKASSELRMAVEETLSRIVDRDVFERVDPVTDGSGSGMLARLFGQKKKTVQADRVLPEILALSDWQKEIAHPNDTLEHACLTGLNTVVGGIVGQRGRLIADKEMVVGMASTIVCSSYGSLKLSDLIEPILHEAVEKEGFRRLPFQEKPFMMNVKGASAAGKSTIRPLQRELAERLGVPWEDFALVSPDYWRKFLLDYDSVGENYKYAAMLTGQELEIIDKKLDRYMERKAAQAKMPHLLIDRFRFDSFVSSTNQQADGRLLSRFGHTVFMFFVITPPTETVERAWKRGKETGRYKAVDDLLYHNIEAYTGMPQLFLSWVNKKRQKVHFEFLDNSVPYGKRPRTVAFGWNGEITIMDIDCMRRMNSYRRINVDATQPEDVYVQPLDGEEDIIEKIIEHIPKVTIIDAASLDVLVQISDGVCTFERDDFLEKTGLAKLCRRDATAAGQPLPAKADIEGEQKFTVGSWDYA